VASLRAAIHELLLLAFISRWISIAIYVMVAVTWLVADRRIEGALHEKSK